MRTKVQKTRCVKRQLTKCVGVCRTYDDVQYAGADYVNALSGVKSFECNVLLKGLAEVNTNRMHAFVVKSMNEVLSGAFGFEEDLIPDDVPALYVLTDENKTFGASQLYLKDKIREFAEKNSCDVYILPSSVHELLLLRADFPNLEPSYLKEMVCEVNATEVSDEDFLCDGAYKFELATDKIIAL